MVFEIGKWLVLCDRCGFRRTSDQIVKTWDGYMVCAPSIKPGCFETRHPQDFVRDKPDDQSVPFTRSEGADVFRTVDTIAPSVGVQETTIPEGHFTTNNETIE